MPSTGMFPAPAPHIGLRHIPLRPAKLLAPLHGSDWDAPALGDFYNQAFDGSVSLPVAGYNYNSGWISFCWRDLHPLEWQLASLHAQSAPRSVVLCTEHALSLGPHFPA